MFKYTCMYERMYVCACITIDKVANARTHSQTTHEPA